MFTVDVKQQYSNNNQMRSHECAIFKDDIKIYFVNNLSDLHALNKQIIVADEPRPMFYFFLSLRGSPAW